MQVKVYNCPDKYFKPYVIKATEFFAKELILNNRIRNNCYTVIIFNNKIKEYGYAEIKGYNTAKQAREFIIEIHPGIGARNIFETLAHEMVHQWEWLNYGDMTHGPKFFVWRNELAKFGIVLSRKYRIKHYKLV